MADQWKIGFVGAGVMAEVMIAGLLDEGVVAADRVLASNRRASRSEELAELYGIRTSTDNAMVAAEADIVVLSVKPQTLAKVLSELKGKVNPEATVLSIVAGARTGLLQRGLGHERVARCMPNLPCRIRQG